MPETHDVLFVVES